MSVRERRIISAMTPEAQAQQAQREAQGLDPVTGKPTTQGVKCECEVKHGKNKPCKQSTPVNSNGVNGGGA